MTRQSFRLGVSTLLLAVLILSVWSTHELLDIAVAHATQPSAHLVALLNPGKRPEPVIVDAAHHRVYIGTETGGSVTAVDDRTNRILKRIPVGREVEDLALNPRSGMLYAASSVVSRLTVISTSRLRVATIIRNVTDASGVALDASRHRLYVAEQSANSVAVIDTAQNRIIRTLRLAGGPLGIGLDTALHRVFVGLFKLHRVDVIRESSDKLLGSVQVGIKPVHPFRVDSPTHRLYVVNSGSSTVSVVDTRSLRVVQTIRTEPNPEGLDIRPADHRAYVSNEGDPGTDKNSGRTASVIDIRTGRIIDTLRVIHGPDGIAYDPNNGDVYVSNEDPGRVSVIKLPSRDR